MKYSVQSIALSHHEVYLKFILVILLFSESLFVPFQEVSLVPWVAEAFKKRITSRASREHQNITVIRQETPFELEFISLPRCFPSSLSISRSEVFFLLRVNFTVTELLLRVTAALQCFVLILVAAVPLKGRLTL